MKKTTTEAWRAFEAGELERADMLWRQAVEEAPSPGERRCALAGYGYTLVALGRFDQARELYEKLLKETDSHVFLHQLCMVEREAGEYGRALEYALAEQDLIEPEDRVAVAANLYELAKVHMLMGKHQTAESLAQECLDVARSTDDLVLRGCAWRLMGEILSETDPKTARLCLLRGQEEFHQAGDGIAMEEVGRILDCLPEEAFLDDDAGDEDPPDQEVSGE